MALIFLRVPIVFNLFSLKFRQVIRRNFIVKNEWSPVHPTSIHCIVRHGKMLVLLQAATEAKIGSQVDRCTFADLVCVAGESHRQRCERQLQLTAGMCVSQRWKF